MKTFVHLYSRQKMFAIIITIMIPCEAYVEVLSKSKIAPVLDSISNVPKFQKATILILTLMSIHFFLETVTYFVSREATFRLQADIRKSMVEFLLQGEITSVENTLENEAREIWSSDVEDIGRISITSIPRIGLTFLVSFFSLYQLWRLSKVFLFAALVLMVFGLAPSQIIGKKAQRSTDIFREKESRISLIFFRIFEHLNLHRNFGNEKNVLGQFSTASIEYIDAKVVNLLWNHFYRTLSRVISSFTPLVFITSGAWLIEFHQVSFGDVAAALALASSLTDPITELGNLRVNVESLRTKMGKIFSTTLNTVGLLPGTKKEIFPGQVSIKIHKTIVRGKMGENILKVQSLDIKPGEKVAVIGKSGSGKTALLRLIMGLYVPSTGEVNICQERKPLHGFDEIRHAILYQSSHPEILESSLRDNLIYGNRELSKELFPNPVHNELFSRDPATSISADTISGGQRKLVGFIRSVRIPAAAYIWDEITTGVDSNDAKRMIGTVLALDATVIWATHDYDGLEKFDRIIILDDGNIIEDGAAKETIDNSENFAALIK